MLFRRKAQSTAEYAILLGLVVAVAAGVLQVALRGGMRQKNKQALDLMLEAGGEDIKGTTTVAPQLFSQEYRQTTVKGGAADFADKTVMDKGGLERKYQKQTTGTKSVSVETIEAATGSE